MYGDAAAILVDLAGLSVRRRAALGPALAAALAGDPERPRFLGFSGLGLAEILRPRRHAPLHELLAGPHAAALAAARALARQAPPFPRQTLRASPSVVGAFAADASLTSELRHALGYQPALRADPGLPALDWHLEAP